MNYHDSLDVCKQLIAQECKGYQWEKYQTDGRYTPISAEAKIRAIEILDDPKNSLIKDGLKYYLEQIFECRVNHDYLYRILAFVLDDKNYICQFSST